MNVERRNLFKLLALGAGVGFVTHAIGSEGVKYLQTQTPKGAMVRHMDIPKPTASASTQSFDAFDVVEQEGVLNILAKNGESLFIIDKEK